MDDYDTDEFRFKKNSEHDEDISHHAGGGGSFNNFRNNRYKKAYGNYGGGYSSSGYQAPPLGFGPDSGFLYDAGFGPEPRFGPELQFQPEPRFGSEPRFGRTSEPKPFFARGRGYGPNGPPVKRNNNNDKAFRYLLHCGVPRENIKHLPKDLLQQISPQHCGICSQSFDTYSISRVHYNSKNHLKNQKRWLSQMAMNFGQCPNEAPVKARELYCELCDVQITSTTHSESHYAGKPHRAIVEGRRKPKNTVLLQNGMENRLELLIRREKKALKNIIIEEAVVEAVTEKKVNKTSVPELHCEICKINLVSTEQMILHLNGKKHLAKEKHHILMAMKQPAKATSDAVDIDDGEEKNEDENKDGIKKEPDTTDWGEGCVGWEDF
ncbi:hypothetical protein ACJJTC_008092 [Scirpophaga incertulas]